MNNIFRIPMQFFAEDGDAPAAAGTETTPDAVQGIEQPKSEAPAEKTFTQSEVNKMISERLARERKKFDEEKQEAAELAKMNAAEKAEHAAKKREQELTARETAIQQKELRYEALNILEEANLPSKLVDCVDLTSAETSKASIDAIKSAWTEALTAAVDARLRSDPPAYSGGNEKNDAFLSGFMEG